MSLNVSVVTQVWVFFLYSIDYTYLSTDVLDAERQGVTR